MAEPVLLWLRRDLRLSDNPALTEAVERGGPVIPVFILDDLVAGFGAAPRWRLEASLADLGRRLAEKGSRLILRRGEALPVLRELIAGTGATGVLWSRLYDGPARERDGAIKAALRDEGIDVRSVNGSLLHEPWTVETKTGGFYKVYTPFSKACLAKAEPDEPLPEPGRIPAPEHWPASDALEDWGLGAAMNRGARVVANHAAVGEEAARGRLGAFIAHALDRYKSERDRPDLEATSRLSENLALGEISPRTAWAATRAAFEREPDAEREGFHFLKELLWREFAYHLLYHTPSITTRNWREQWDGFPWRDDNEDAERWRRGRTGEPMVDAAMREMYVTGTMHNRSRMIVASYLCKHLLTHWKVGEAWFRDCLIDWDIASNAMGWQWTAGSGPDAAPYFRIYNPRGQAEKHDPEGTYTGRWIAEGAKDPHPDALSYFEAIPRSWSMAPEDPYPSALIDLSRGRQRALDAYEQLPKAS